MADLTAAEVTARFPEFATKDTKVVEAAISDAYTLTDISNDITIYAVGHLLALADEESGHPDGGSGVVKSSELGSGKRLQFLTMSRHGKRDPRRDVFFETTTYGRRVLAMESSSFAASFSVIGG